MFGVLGGLALIFFFVAIAVPVIRWRKRSRSTTQSRASSRRTHARIFSGNNNQDAVAPLLEEQPPSSMVVNEGAPTPTLAAQNQRTTAPSRPPTALLNWKILQTLPNFDNDSDSSSLGNPLEPGEHTFKEGGPTLRIVDQDRRSAALPPIPAREEVSRSSTLVAPLSPTSPLINAFQRALTPSTTDTISHTNSISTFRYPSLTASSTSKSPAPTIDSQNVASNHPKDPTRTSAPSWLPKSLVPGAENPTQTDSWWRVPSMPPIPESVGSASISSLQRTSVPKQESPPSTARLRDSNASAGPSVIRHIGRLSAEFGTGGTAGTLSRSSTQRTSQSVAASIVERPVSAITHGTFGRQGHSDSSSREPSDTKPLGTDESGLLMPTSPEEENVRQGKRRTFDYPREPSPPFTPAPLSAPPVPHTLRSGNDSHSNHLSSQPMPDPHSPEEPEPESGMGGPYGHNQEASNSSEHLLPSSDSAPLLPEIPTMPQLSPLGFEFRIDTPDASRNNSSSTRRSRKSIKDKGKVKVHEKSPSKASIGSALSSATGSKRSLRSLRSLASFASTRSGSSASRSKSRERSKHGRHVTFGEVENPPPLIHPAEEPSGSVDPFPEPRQPSRRASRPLPTPPATLVPSSVQASPFHQASNMAEGPTAKGGYDVP